MPRTPDFRLGWIVLAGLTALVGGCAEGPLAPRGPVAASEKIILLDSLAIMLAIVVPTILATIVVAWWFRASNTRAKRLPLWSYSGRLELIVWSIPTLVVLFLGGIAWIGSHRLDPAEPLASTAGTSTTAPLEIDVVSLDWKWLFIYPAQGVASVNQLVLPAGRPVHFRITSASVMNVFFIPQLGSEIYCMNGMISQINLLAYQPGVFAGLSAHFSGDGFAGMDFKAIALPADRFAEWARGRRASGPPLDAASYQALLVQTQNVRPYTYGSVQAGLFDAVAARRVPEGRGPAGETHSGSSPNPRPVS